MYFEVGMTAFWGCSNSWICKGKETLPSLAPTFWILTKTFVLKFIAINMIFVLRRELHLNCWGWECSMKGEESNVSFPFQTP